mgnify:CR=1 FL=1
MRSPSRRRARWCASCREREAAPPGFPGETSWRASLRSPVRSPWSRSDSRDHGRGRHADRRPRVGRRPRRRGARQSLLLPARGRGLRRPHLVSTRSSPRRWVPATSRRWRARSSAGSCSRSGSRCRSRCCSFPPSRCCARCASRPSVVPLAVGYAARLDPRRAPALVFVVLRQTLQALGRVRPVVVTILAANLLNAALCYGFVFGPLGRLPGRGRRRDRQLARALLHADHACSWSHAAISRRCSARCDARRCGSVRSSVWSGSACRSAPSSCSSSACSA